MSQHIKQKQYEAVFIVRPNLDDEAVDRIVNSVEEFIKTSGGKILNSEKKGRRRLAYEVKKMRDGFFVMIRFEVSPDSITALKRMLSLTEEVIRSLVVVQDEKALASTL